MQEIIEIRNRRTSINIFIDQFGGIIGLQSGLIICSFFIDFSWVIIGQIILLPIFIVLLVSKFNKPVKRILIIKPDKLFQFHVSTTGQTEKIIKIPFDNLKIERKFKWLLNYYQEVLEIKDKDTLKVVVPINKSNSNFVNDLLIEIELLPDLISMNKSIIETKKSTKAQQRLK